MEESTRILRRYTSLAAALHALETKSLTLLPPDKWDDEIDRGLMAAYRRRQNLQSVLALCFSAAGETYHHWRVFAQSDSGACLTFERKRLEKSAKHAGVVTKRITYKKIADDRAQPVTTAELPFTKRFAFRDEREVRMLFTSADKELKFKSVPFEPGALEELILSPWTPDALVDSIRNSVQRIPGLPVVEVRKSTLFNSKYWRAIADA